MNPCFQTMHTVRVNKNMLQTNTLYPSLLNRFMRTQILHDKNTPMENMERIYNLRPPAAVS